jgi:hypothetical protein
MNGVSTRGGSAVTPGTFTCWTVKFKWGALSRINLNPDGGSNDVVIF